MIQQDDIIQPVLTGDEVRKAAAFARSMTAPSDTTQPGDYVMAGALAALSKLRAPVAGEAQQESAALRQARHDTANAQTDRERIEALAYWLDQQKSEPEMLSCAAATLRAMLTRDAAPQASAEPAQPCSCPSGDGSLRHPCAVHPTSATQPEQGERDAC